MPDQCQDDNAVFYVQFSCEQSTEVLLEKFRQTSQVACFGVLISFIFLIAIYYLKRESKMMYIEWDMKTITPGDYSQEYEISEASYNWFLENYYNIHDKPRGISPGHSFKNYLKN